MAIAPGYNPFDAQRQRAVQRSGADAQTAGDAINRRFASMGALNSGAAIKQQQMAQDQAAQRRDEAVSGVDAAEAQDLAQKQEAEMQRQYGSQEALKARDFQAAQGGIDRSFQGEQNAMSRALQEKNLAQQIEQFKLAQDESAFNRRLENYKAGNSGGFLGGGGFLGTGIGAKPTNF